MWTYTANVQWNPLLTLIIEFGTIPCTNVPKIIKIPKLLFAIEFR